MTDDQVKSIKLLVDGLNLAQKSGLKIVCSVDISTCEDDAYNRCFGEFEEVNSLPSDTGFGSNEIQLLFSGELNTK